MANWQQKLANATIGIKNLDRNTAQYIIRIDSLNDFFGGNPLVYELSRELIVSAPSPVNVRLVDGLNYLAGDFVCQVSYLQLAEAMKPQSGDPEIIVNGKASSLSEQRPFIASRNWGIDVGDDVLSIGGDKWTIVAVKGEDWLNNEPSSFTLTLRK